MRHSIVFLETFKKQLLFPPKLPGLTWQTGAYKPVDFFFFPEWVENNFYKEKSGIKKLGWVIQGIAPVKAESSLTTIQPWQMGL